MVFLKWILSFALFLPALVSAAPARLYKAIIMPIDGLILQGIPAGNRSLFPSDEVLSITGDRIYHYHIRQGARQLLPRLVADGYAVYLLSYQDQKTSDAIQNTLTLANGKKLGEVVKVIVLDSDLRRQPLTPQMISLVGAAPSDILTVAPSWFKLSSELEENSYRTGKTFFAFPSFEKSQEAKSAAQSGYFANTAQEWLSERNNLITFFALFSVASTANEKAAFHQKIQKLAAVPIERAIEAGKQLLSGNQLGSFLRWETKSTDGQNHAVCQKSDLLGTEPPQTADLNECLGQLPSFFQLVKKGSTFHCLRFTQENGPLIRAEDGPSACFDHTKNLRFLKSRPSAPSCAAYTNDFELVGAAPLNRCGSDFVIQDPADRKQYVYRIFDGAEKLSEADLLQRAKTWNTSPTACLAMKEALDRVCARRPSKDPTCPTDTLAYHRESCLIGEKNDLIQEVVQLPNASFIPKEIYQKYEPEKIALSLIYRRFQTVDRPKITSEKLAKPSFLLYEDAEPLMAFGAGNLSAIIQKGFLNQHQTRTTGGSRNLDNRQSTENRFFQLALEQAWVDDSNSIVNFLRPKYAFGHYKKSYPGLTHEFHYQYGNVHVAFKNVVKKRTTITNSDSLGFTGVYVETFFQPDPKDMLDRSTGQYYREAQIWGRLTIQDVAYFLVDCINPSGDGVISTLKAANLDIPVYSCQLDKQNGWQSVKPVKLLYGTPPPPVQD